MDEKNSKRYENLKTELTQIDSEDIDMVKRITRNVELIRKNMEELKAEILTNPFVSQQEEITFFKTIKPKFYAWQIYYLELLNIHNRKPIGGSEQIKEYYREEMNYIIRFYQHNQFYYQYYKLEATELDTYYFVRGNETRTLLIPESPPSDPLFSTMLDYLFSKFIAYDKLQDYLSSQLYEPYLQTGPLWKSKKGRQLQWTGDKLNLVEIAYGIFITAQINEGDVDLSDIMDWLEQSLQVNLNRYSRRFSEIKMRKSVSKTRYLDELREALLKYINEGDAFRPGLG